MTKECKCAAHSAVECCCGAWDEPLQRTWVGLTDEDKLTAKYMQDAPDGIDAVIGYIEDRLKEKNT